MKNSYDITVHSSCSICFISRSRNYVRQNSDELVSIAPHLVRRPLSISSSTSSTSSSGEGEGSSDGSVIDLTRERVIGNDGDEQRASRRVRVNM